MKKYRWKKNTAHNRQWKKQKRHWSKQNRRSLEEAQKHYDKEKIKYGTYFFKNIIKKCMRFMWFCYIFKSFRRKMICHGKMTTQEKDLYRSLYVDKILSAYPSFSIYFFNKTKTFKPFKNIHGYKLTYYISQQNWTKSIFG